MVKKIIFILLLAVGIFFRIFAIEQIPGGLFGDEVSLAVNTKTIAQSGTDEYGNKHPFAFESFSDYKMPGYIYASVIPFAVFGPRIVSIRFIAIISSIISIFLIGVLAKLLFPRKKNIAPFAMITLALSPYAIHFGRIAYETMFATTLLLGFFIAFIKSIQKPSALWHSVGIICLLSACWTYPAPQFIIPFFLVCVILAAFLIRPKDATKQIIVSSFLYFLFALLSFIPELLNPLMNKRTLGYVFVTGNSKVPFFAVLMQRSLMVLSSWLRSFNLEFLFDKGDVFAYRSGTKLVGVFLPIFLPALLIGIYSFIKQFSKKEFSSLLLLIMLIACGLPSALTWSVPYGPRFLPMIIPLSILIALGLSTAFDWIHSKKLGIQRFVFVTVLLVLCYQLLYFADVYFIRFPILSEPEFVSATQGLGIYLAQERQTHPTDTIYFLEGRSCSSWSYSDLHFWYYANLPNAPMIAWDKQFRDIRQATGNPFDAYNFLTIPTGRFDHIILYPTTEEMAHSPKGSILVHCGISLKDLSPHSEHIEKVFYLYGDIQQNPVYVVSRKL